MTMPDAAQYLIPEGHSRNDPSQRDEDGGDHIVSEPRRRSGSNWWLRQGRQLDKPLPPSFGVVVSVASDPPPRYYHLRAADGVTSWRPATEVEAGFSRE